MTKSRLNRLGLVYFLRAKTIKKISEFYPGKCEDFIAIQSDCLTKQGEPVKTFRCTVEFLYSIPEFPAQLWQRFENSHGENRSVKSSAALGSERETEFNVSNFARSSPNLIRTPEPPLAHAPPVSVVIPSPVE